MDKFKAHIQQHREELDIDEPGPQVWGNISKEMRPKTKVRNLFAVKAAAASALLFVGLFSYLYLKPKNEVQVAAIVMPIQVADTTKTPPRPRPVVDTSTEDTHIPILPLVKTKSRVKAQRKMPTATEPARQEQASTDAYATAFTEVEKTYGGMIDNQLNIVRQTPVYGVEASYFYSFGKQFKSLAKEEEAIKADYKHNGLTEEQIERTITVLQQKINLLKQLQSEIKKVNNKVKKPTPEAKPKATFINI